MFFSFVMQNVDRRLNKLNVWFIFIITIYLLITRISCCIFDDLNDKQIRRQSDLYNSDLKGKKISVLPDNVRLVINQVSRQNKPILINKYLQ